MVDEQRPATQEEPDVAASASPPPDGSEANGHANGVTAPSEAATPEDAAQAFTREELAADQTPDLDTPQVAQDTIEAASDVVIAAPPAPEPVDENAGLVATFPEVALPPRQYFPEAPAWLPPEFEAQEERAVSPPLGRAPGRLPAAVLALLMSGVYTMFLLIEPTPMWLALFGAIVAAVGTDGVLRSIRREAFEVESGRDTVPHIFLPVLFTLAVPLFIEENLPGYWVVPAAILAAFAFVLLVLAEVPAEDEEEDEFRGRARFVSVAGTYFVAFALFSLTYAFDIGLREALIAIALGSVLLAVELLREGEIDPLETLLLAGVVGIVVAQARWILQFMPLDGYPAGLALLLTFYFVTGMVHAYMTRHINRTVTVEYSIVTALGLILVVAARATGVA